MVFLYGVKILIQKALEEARKVLEKEDPEQLLQDFLDFEDQAEDTGVTVVNLIESFNLPTQE